MKNKIIDVFAFLECFVRNEFSRYSAIVVVIGIFSIFNSYIVIGLFMILAGLFVLWMIDFGMSSFRAYKKGFERLHEKEFPLESRLYCVHIGFKVAEQRFEYENPEKYKNIMKKADALHQEYFFEIGWRLRERN